MLSENAIMKDAYRINEFCLRYSISRSAFYSEVRAKRLRVTKRGCSTLIVREDAEMWLAYLQMKPLSDTSVGVCPDPL